MRYYAPWVARFISVDPLQFKYPIYTPYQYAGNKPISNIDLDGAEELNKVDNTGMWSTMPSSGTISEGVTFSSNEDPANYNTEGFSSLYMGKIPKYPYTGNGWDYVAQFDNAAINILNTVPSLWNSSVANVENLVGGTWSDQMSSELSYTWDAIATRADTEWDYLWGTRIDKQLVNLGITWSKPQNLEMLTTAVFVSQMPNFQLPKFNTSPNRLSYNINRYDINARNVLKKIESETSGAHFYSRHGAQTTEWDQFLRAHLGITPDDVFKSPIASTKYYSNQLQLNAYQHAMRIYKSTGKQSFEFGMGYNVGGGFFKNGLIFHETNMNYAVFNEFGQIKTLYPLLKK